MREVLGLAVWCSSRDHLHAENPWCMMSQAVTTEAPHGSTQIGLGLGVSVSPAPVRQAPPMTAAAATDARPVAKQADLDRVAMGGRPGPLRVRGSDRATEDRYHDQWRRDKDGRTADLEIADHDGRHHMRWSRRLQRDVRVGDMPWTRAECPAGPCPWVRCRHHMATEVHHDGALIVHHEGPWPKDGRAERKEGKGLIDSVATEIAAGTYETCGLRLAEQGPRGVAEIAEVMGICRQQVAKDEQSALRKLRALGRDAVREMLGGMANNTGQDWPDWVV